MTGKVKNFINRELDTKSSQFDRIVNNFEVFSRNAAVISDASGKALIHTLKNLEYITDEVKKYIGEGEGPDRQKVEGLKDAIRKINTTLNELQKTTENFREITEKINKGEGTLGKLVNDDKLIKKTEEMVTETGNLIKTITRLETQIGFRSEFNYHERAIKNYFELKLQPNPNKYYLIGLTFDPRGKTKIIERVTLSNDPSVPPALTERVTETTMDLKFSLEFAYRWYFLTGRFGVIESTGGIGLDGEFLKDSMKFSFDLFDFDSDKYPRLKWLWTFEFIKHFFIAAGIDDILNKMGRDYFAGAGVRFTDDDLKALLIASPSIKY
jgi:phospholipid/cholesterol/gamma-HCH transport system substrate-binding protein